MSCSSVCSICLNEDSPLGRVTRRSKKINWLQCDCCKNWLHAECGGYTITDYMKFSKDGWLKCVVCCLQKLRSSFSEGTFDISSLVTQAVNNQITPVLAAKNTAINQSVGYQDNFLSAKEYAMEDVSVVSKVDEQCESNELPCQSHSSTCTLPESHAFKSKEIHEEKLVVFPEDFTAENILIIDNINNPSEFASSKRILKEVNLFCPEVKVDFAYSLAKGGVAIHTVDKIGRDILLDKLPEESFGGGFKHFPKNKCLDTVFVKGVCSSVSTQEFTNVLNDAGIETIEVRRLINRRTGKPIRVLKVKCSQESSSLLCGIKILVRNVACVIEKQRRTRVIRCYKCQRFGHLAKFCTNHIRCEFCAGSHECDKKCFGEAFCANCSGNHPSYSTSCPSYISRYALITEQYTKC